MMVDSKPSPSPVRRQLTLNTALCKFEERKSKMMKEEISRLNPRKHAANLEF